MKTLLSWVLKTSESTLHGKNLQERLENAIELFHYVITITYFVSGRHIGAPLYLFEKYGAMLRDWLYQPFRPS